MSQIKSLLIRANIEVAARGRICHRNRKNHTIAPGETCLVTIEDMGSKRNYCRICAGQMLEKAKNEISSMMSSFI